MVAPGDRSRARRLSDRDLFLAHGVLHQHPIGVLALLLSVGYLPRRPIADIKTDWVGMALLVLAVGALQYVLDQGQTRDWFSSKAIVAGTIIAVFAGAAFFLRGWNRPDNIIDLSLLRDRNFVAGTLAMTAYGISLFGWMAIMPLFSQRLLGYPPATAGTLFIPRGLVSAITLAITGKHLIRMFDARISSPRASSCRRRNPADGLALSMWTTGASPRRA